MYVHDPWTWTKVWGFPEGREEEGESLGEEGQKEKN